MIRYSGGQKAVKGTYWNFTTGERLDIRTEGVLPGGERTTYYRLPASGILLLAPVLGLLYAVFLPFIGIAMAVRVLLKKMGLAARSTARTGASFGWRPSESYLTGKKEENGKETKGEEKKDENG
jgi:hypothetical protein